MHVSHELPYELGKDNPYLPAPDSPRETFEANLEIVIEPPANDRLEQEFSKYLQDLKSTDSKRRNEAAQAIAYLAPPFLENVIIGMLDSSDLRPYAVRGLRNLGTPAAHEALAKFVRLSPPVQSEGEYQDAIRYLGEIGNRGDLELLLRVAHANASESSGREMALESAGKVGGANAVPLLAID